MKRAAAGGLAAVATLLCGQAVSAQAWITPPSEGSIGLFHQFVHSDNHLDMHGQGSAAPGTEWFHTLALDASYGLRDRLAIDGTLIWITTKWSGGPNAKAHGPVDDGTYHSSFQDARIVLRYQAALRPVALAPFVAFGAPTNSYETRGHSAFGRALNELQMGVAAGRAVRARTGLVYLHGSASYSISEAVPGYDFDLDHINGDFAASVPAGSRVSVTGFGSWQVMRDGLDLPLLDDHDKEQFGEDHDRLARASFLNTGLRATVAVTDRLDLTVSGVVTAFGRNVHAVRAITSGLSWNFGGGFKIAPPSGRP
jgi:hypothetical protein